MDDLKPCPFCGYIVEGIITITESYAICTNCNAKIIRKNLLEAIKAWNTRADEEDKCERELYRDMCERDCPILEKKINILLEIVKRTAANTCCLCCDPCLSCDATSVLRKIGETK